MYSLSAIERFLPCLLISLSFYVRYGLLIPLPSTRAKVVEIATRARVKKTQEILPADSLSAVEQHPSELVVLASELGQLGERSCCQHQQGRQTDGHQRQQGAHVPSADRRHRQYVLQHSGSAATGSDALGSAPPGLTPATQQRPSLTPPAQHHRV